MAQPGPKYVGGILNLLFFSIPFGVLYWSLSLDYTYKRTVHNATIQDESGVYDRFIGPS
jgi:hypothetical protein